MTARNNMIALRLQQVVLARWCGHAQTQALQSISANYGVGAQYTTGWSYDRARMDFSLLIHNREVGHGFYLQVVLVPAHTRNQCTQSSEEGTHSFVSWLSSGFTSLLVSTLCMCYRMVYSRSLIHILPSHSLMAPMICGWGAYCVRWVVDLL